VGGRMKKNWNIPCNFGTSVEVFEHFVGRKPKNKKEMEEWVNYLRKGVEAQLDWDIIHNCASENLK
jgi:hypothetical protein